MCTIDYKVLKTLYKSSFGLSIGKRSSHIKVAALEQFCLKNTLKVLLEEGGIGID